MTREEALKDLYDYIEYNRNVGRCDLEESDGVEIINEIYDDFESRSCGSCKWKLDEFCIKFDDFRAIKLLDSKGCSKFERKAKES